jgi:nucleotide sugar dehydrogenase
MLYKSVNIIGYGFVGSAIGYLCKKNKISFNVCDLNDKQDEYQFKTDDVSEIVKHSEAENETNFYFIAVPTPANEDYTPNVSIVDNVLNQLDKNATKTTYAIIKSTLCPGSCQKFCDKYNNIKVILCPEFLRESSYHDDIYNAQFVLLGVTKEQVYAHLGYNDVILLFRDLYCHNIDIPVYVKSYEECELFKYTLNVYLAVKVWYFNEIYEVCDKLGVQYDSLKTLFRLDERIGKYGIEVPGPDGKFGYGLSCLPKETKGMMTLQGNLGIDNDVLKHIIKRNNAFREK